MPHKPLSLVFALGLICCDGDDDSSSTTGESANEDSGTDTTGKSSTGDDVTPPEAALCQRSDECNVLTPGVSVQDCTDLELMCTEKLITTAYQDWTIEIGECLVLANCQNFLDCVSELSACPPVQPAAQGCEATCNYCWVGTELEGMCPAEYELDGDCDCGCQFVDPRC